MKLPKIERVAYLFGEIDDQSSQVLLDEIYAHTREFPKEPLTILINSHGGFCNSGFALYNEIKRLNDLGLTINTRIIGRAASIAGVVALAGKKREISKHAFVMIHGVSSEPNTALTVVDFKRQAEDLRFTQEVVQSIYMERTDMSKSYFNYILSLNVDFNLTPEEAYFHGIVDEII